MRRKITPPIRARIEYMLDDRWPFIEISRTTGIPVSTLQRQFPGRGWTPQETAEWMEIQKGDHDGFPPNRRSERWA